MLQQDKKIFGKFDMVKELINVRDEQYEVPDFSREELDDILEHLCID